MPIMPEVTDEDGLALFEVPFHPHWVDAIKRLVPARSREWRPESKLWAVHPIYRADVIDLTRRIFGAIRIRDSRSSSEPRRTGKAGDHFAVLHLLPSAPPEVIDAAFRAMAKMVHPDVGGSTESMRRLTEAHEALSRRLSV